MLQITLVRHGQANNTATDEAGYDSLSDLGRQQARWLGAHMREIGEPVARVYAGSLRRHLQSAEEWGAEDGGLVIDERLNELRYFEMSTLMEKQHGVPHPRDHAGFIEHLPMMFSFWREGRLDGAPESFEAFETRVRGVLGDIAARGEPAIVFTSGGFIGMVLRLVLGLDGSGFARATLPILNTSVHRFAAQPAGLSLTQFNAVPHLERPGRQHARTHF